MRHLTSFCLATGLLALTSSALSAPLDPEKPLRELFDECDADWQNTTGITKAKEPGNMAWGESYRLMAYPGMYEATRDTKYLDHLTHRFDALLTVRDDRTGRRDEFTGKAMPAWGTAHYSKPKWHCWIVHAGMLTYPAASFVRIVKADPNLQARYGAKADEYAAALKETIAGYDPDWRNGPGEDEGYYIGRALGDKHLPLNQMNALGRTLAELAVALDDPVCRDRASRLARFFEHRLTTKPSGAYDWAYWPPTEPAGPSSGEDISHAAINAEFAVLCYERGIVFDRADMDHFAATFTKSIYKGPGNFAASVAGKGEKSRYSVSVGRWVRLAQFDPQIAAAVKAYYFSLDPFPRGSVPMLGLANLLKYGK